MAGLELDFSALRGDYLRMAAAGFLASFALAGRGEPEPLRVGMVLSPILVAVTLSSTSVGLVIPILKDAEKVETEVGRLVIANASIAEFMTVALLTVFSSTSGKRVEQQVIVLAIFAGLGLALFVGLSLLWGRMRYVTLLDRLKDTTAQIRIRAAIVILLAAVAIAGHFGLEAILGAFMAGAILSVLHRGWTDDLLVFRSKLDAVGSGFFIPAFFVLSGLHFDLNALFDAPSTALRVPIYLALLLLVRGLPAILYRERIDRAEKIAAGLMQATSLSFIVVATGIGTELHVMTTATASALVAPGLLSVLIFPASALSVLRREASPRTDPTSTP